MKIDFSRVDALVNACLGSAFPAAQIEILVGGARVYSRAMGWLDPETKSHPTNDTTRFDLASVSKLFTTAAFMTLVEEGSASLDEPVAAVFPDFSGERPIAPYPDPLKPGQFVVVEQPPPDLPLPGGSEQRVVRVNASDVTFRQLLAHNSGLPAWLPLWRMNSRDEARDTVFNTEFAYPTGTRVLYSDIGLILLGWAIEKIAGQSLREVVRERVTAPLDLGSIQYGPLACENIAPTEFYTHQGRRMCGEVHDENAWALGGASGHAGLFGTAREVAAFGEMFRHGKASVLKKDTIEEMTHLQAQDGAVRRGIGFALWSPDPEASSHPLSERAYGHLGFTGTCLWIDPARDLVVGCMTNRVYYGRTGADMITPFRHKLNLTICEILDGQN